MKCTMYWHGGSSYRPSDPHNPADGEIFASIKEAKASFASRPGDSYYPCVSDENEENGGPSAWLFLSDNPEEIAAQRPDPYPDYVMSFGPRGGVRLTPA